MAMTFSALRFYYIGAYLFLLAQCLKNRLPRIEFFCRKRLSPQSAPKRLPAFRHLPTVTASSQALARCRGGRDLRSDRHITMKIISSVELTKGYAHWKGLFDANEPLRQEHGVKVLAVGHEPDNENKVWTCIEVESMEKMMAMANSPGMIKLREEAGAKLDTQTWTQLVE